MIKVINNQNQRFLNFLKSNNNSRKVFGKRELKIIEKQLFGVNLTQSEKNRLSRDIRKKLEFVKEISIFSKEFELKKFSIINEIVEEKKQHILDSKYFPDIKKIVLFGSTVENQRSFRSDIDIAVEFEEINVKEATKFRIEMNLDKNVDVQVYNLLPDKIKKEINEKGKVIYERENK
jgi:predicted nucleotidyltransferase